MFPAENIGRRGELRSIVKSLNFRRIQQRVVAKRINPGLMAEWIAASATPNSGFYFISNINPITAYGDNPEKEWSGNAVGIGLAINTKRDEAVASPDSSRDESLYSSQHDPSHTAARGPAGCESQPDPVPPPLPQKDIL